MLFTQSDISPRVWVQIGDDEMQLCKSWSLDFDVLQLGDPFSLDLDNADGRNAWLAGKRGAPISVYVEDPQVSTGRTLLYTGVVVHPQFAANAGGCTVNVSGADLGWMLNSCHAPYWRGIQGLTWARLYSLLVDSSWGFAGLRTDNDENRRIRQGRITLEREWSGQAPDALPPIQTMPGDAPADLLIRYAKLQKRLVNVSADGYLQVWKPRYDQRSQYTFALYKSTTAHRNDGNIKDARLDLPIDGLYTDVRCFSSVVDPTIVKTPGDWHAGEIKGRYVPPVSPLPFSRPHYFSDSEQYTNRMAKDRAQWKWQRGQYDSWTYTITVPGVSQGGIFYANDTICTVEDEIHGVKGLYYVSAVRMNRNLQSGTSTTLTIKQKGLLAA